MAGNISGYQCGNCNNARNVRINSVRGDQARRLDTGELDAASAAFKVGYESPSQFNREYGRFFGRSPIRDIKPLRDGKVVAITTALRGIAGSLSSHPPVVRVALTDVSSIEKGPRWVICPVSGYSSI